jgi:hypothetical protein
MATPATPGVARPGAEFHIHHPDCRPQPPDLKKNGIYQTTVPALIVSSRYTTDSQRLRQAAQELRWETLRLDGEQIPEWFTPPDDEIALFYTAPHAFDVAGQLARTLLGCPPDWTIRLPPEFLKRRLQQTTLADALERPGRSFVKHAVSKAFPAAVYDARSLSEATSNIPPGALVHVGEVVHWEVEYRAFVRDGRVAAICPYQRHGAIIDDHNDRLDAPQSEIDEAARFAQTVLDSVASPPAFVLDVGRIEGRGWGVVEFNECWASGVYSCDPKIVLEVLLRACVPTDSLVGDDRRWDFRAHYFAACPSG